MKIRKENVYLLSIVLSFFLFAFTQDAEARTNVVTKPETASAKGLKSEAEMIAFFDDLMPKLMEKNHVPGAAVSFVKDGKLILAKGYGYANLSTKKPVNAGETLFRIASISKLFTWIAVMQQVEEGRIDLDADVNKYLTKFKIPDTYPGRPVTMRHLMTHTAGFDDHIEPRLYSKDPTDLEPFWIFMKRTWPPRIRPPGEVSVYSNYGTCLASLIVQEVSGMTFEDYIETRIFRPLGMNRTTIDQPLPDSLVSDMSVGYVYGKNGYLPQEFELIRLPPAGAVSTTAVDMANFMIAQLQLGKYENKRILGEATAREMQSPQFSPAPGVSSLCLGIYETPLHGLRIIGHAGDTVFFHSNLLIIPKERIGLFVTGNSPGGSLLRNDLRAAFLDRYYPAPDPPRPPKDETQRRIHALEGTYESMICNTSTIEKSFFPLVQITMKATPNGTLTALFRKNASIVEEVAPYTFRPVSVVRAFHGDQIFVRDSKGNFTKYYLANAPFMPFRRIPFYATTGFADAVKTICLAVFLTVLIWPVRAVISRREKQEPDGTVFLRAARWIAGSASILMLLFALLLYAMIHHTPLVERFFTGIAVPPALISLLAMPVIAAVLTLCVIPVAAIAWAKKYWTLGGRIHYTFVAAALVAYLWWLNFYNLLGWRF
jgi:CubicO group peptidase (beta-lactamase class C family)